MGGIRRKPPSPGESVFERPRQTRGPRRARVAESDFFRYPRGVGAPDQGEPREPPNRPPTDPPPTPRLRFAPGIGPERRDRGAKRPSSTRWRVGSPPGPGDRHRDPPGADPRHPCPGPATCPLGSDRAPGIALSAGIGPRTDPIQTRRRSRAGGGRPRGQRPRGPAGGVFLRRGRPDGPQGRCWFLLRDPFSPKRLT